MRAMLLILTCFFFSGVTALIYEVLWTRMIVTVIGGAPFAVATILTVVMGGLGLGSYLASRWADGVSTPRGLIRLYGILELLIGLYCLVLPLLLSALRPLYAVVYNRLFAHLLLYNVLTFLVCCLLLILPVVCMGATLPLLCRFAVSSLSHLGAYAGRLYGINTLGAAFGALLCGFLLLEVLGVSGTLALAVAANVAIGSACLYAGRTSKAPVPSPPRGTLAAAADSGAVSLPARSGAAALFLFAVSGFCSMGYEVIWTKLLGLVIGPTTYSFTIVLVTFITGLALGSMIFGRRSDRTDNPLRLMILLQLAAALSALLVSHLLGNSQFFYTKLIDRFQENFLLLHLAKASTLFLFMLPPTICLGAAFPLAGKIVTKSMQSLGKSIGLAYSVNTVGAVLGSFSAGFLLIPLLGKESGLRLLVLLQTACALAVAGAVFPVSWGRRKTWMSSVALGVLTLLACLRLPDWNRPALSQGTYHRPDTLGAALKETGWIRSFTAGPGLLERELDGKVVYYGDGIGGFTTVIKREGGFGGAKYYMLNSGKADASSSEDKATQTLLAHYPMIFHKKPARVMVLGLASGMTAGETLHYPLEKLDVVEISREVIAGSRFFDEFNNGVRSDPRTEIIVQDGRAHLQLTNRTYDVIISEPSNPWMAGLAALFSREFFEAARAKLNTDGIFCQWVQAYQMDWDVFAMILRTFASAFPENAVIQVSRGDYVIMGFKNGVGLERLVAERNLEFARRSKNLSLPSVAPLFRLLRTEDARELSGGGTIHTDDRPRLEFAAPRTMYVYVDPLIKEMVGKRWKVGPATGLDVLKAQVNTDARIDFVEFSLSLESPYEDMGNLDKASAAQRERLSKLYEDYCAVHALTDSYLPDDETRRRCLLARERTLFRNAAAPKIGG